jgi:hypothetical protein
MISLPLNPLIDVPRVDGPDRRDQEGSKEEHDCLLLNNPEFLGVDVGMDGPFDDDGQQASGKE